MDGGVVKSESNASALDKVGRLYEHPLRRVIKKTFDGDGRRDGGGVHLRPGVSASLRVRLFVGRPNLVVYLPGSLTGGSPIGSHWVAVTQLIGSPSTYLMKEYSTESLLIK
jgi:hypothetical protein